MFGDFALPRATDCPSTERTARPARQQRTMRRRFQFKASPSLRDDRSASRVSDDALVLSRGKEPRHHPTQTSLSNADDVTMGGWNKIVRAGATIPELFAYNSSERV